MTRAQQQPKPWKRAVMVAEKCRSGKKLCCFNRQSDEKGAEVVFYLEPGGEPVGRKTAENAIAHGLLAPSGDGLFGSEFSQTWVAS